MKPLPIENHVPRELLEPLRGKRVLITGTSGFVGRWMLESLLHWSGGRDDYVSIYAIGNGCFWSNAYEENWPLGRFFEDKSSDKRGRAENLWPPDPPHYIIHATTDGVGWEHVSALARAAGAKMLLLSSGAVYGGKQNMPWQEWQTICPTSQYGKDKRNQECRCDDVAVIARLFSFIGPGLRRHTGKEFLEADQIKVKADGAVRSYMYAGDLARWLWTILLKGQVGRCYNVGSNEPIKVVDFAEKCATVRNCRMEVEGTIGGQKQVASAPFTGDDATGTYYVPDTTRAETELGLKCEVGLDDAIRRTLAWQKS